MPRRHIAQPSTIADLPADILRQPLVDPTAIKNNLVMKLTPLAAALLAASSLAQSNAVTGADVSIYAVGSPAYYGRVGSPYPNGTAGFVIGHSMSNCGSVHIPWDGVTGGQMTDESIYIAFLLAKLSGDRMVQVSGKSHMKHSRVAYNFSGSGPCLPCQSGPSNHFRMGCYDVYSSGFNGSRTNLGPTTELNPWLGTWDPVGSYFDIGDPGQSGYPATADGVQSLSTSGFSSIKNRMEVPEQALVGGGTFYGQNQVAFKGEPVGKRNNNQVARQANINWNGSSWSLSLTGSSYQGSVLNRWPGATTSMGGNGSDDGRFLVAVKVTGPTNGMWHYEYAVQNIDNDRGGASLRIPVCATAQVENIGFRDIDQNPLNEWSINRTGGELQFLASANNSLDWNTFYNFYFDSDAAPVAGLVDIDQARPGPGGITVDVATTVPGLLGTEYLGAGCGAPEPTVAANGLPSSPNANYALNIAGGGSNFALIAIAAATQNLPLGGGCNLLIDNSQMIASPLVQLNAAGQYQFPIPIGAGQAPIDLAVQVVEFYPGGPFLGFGALSNGLRIRVAGSGCQ
jgi:hypothetical protein